MTVAAPHEPAFDRAPIELPHRVRMGIHGGRPTLTEDGYVGVAVHTVARISALARGGQILISRQALASLGEDRPSELTFVDLGEHHLRGLGAQGLFQVSAPDLPGEFPALA